MFDYQCFLDTETASPIDIKNGGARYAEDCDTLIVTYAIGDGEVKAWDRYHDKKMPRDLRKALRDPRCEIVMQNGIKFDRLTMRANGIADLPIERITDVMVLALMHALPGGLDEMCKALKVPVKDAKDKRGKLLINRFCKPLKPASKWGKRGFKSNLEVMGASFEKKGDIKARDKLRADYAYFRDVYACKDITSMRHCWKRIPRWNCTTREMRLLALDTEINDRGVYLDIKLIDGALAAIAEEQAYLKERAYQLTDGAFHTNQVALLRKHLEDTIGIELPGVGADVLLGLLERDDLDEWTRELIEVRLAASSSSTAKYQLMKTARMADGRVRGMLQFAGASRTARWAGRIIQPQNFPRPSLKDYILPQCIEMLRNMHSRRARKLLAATMEVCTSALRGCIIPTPGKKLVVADLSNIEGRGLAFLAGEKWKLEAFAAYDRGEGEDLYKLAYARAFNISADAVDDLGRQIGKVMELGLGYGGGVGAFMQFAKVYRLDLYALADVALDNDLIPRRIWKQAHKFWHNPKFAAGHKKLCRENKISKREWMVCDSLKRMWREAHPETVKFWYACEEAARNAIDNPGEWFDAGEHISFQMTKRGWLRMRLPSGRYVCYPDASIRLSRKHSDEDKDEDDGDGDFRITYMGMYKSAKWLRMHTYSGKLAENATQAFARDVLGYNMPKINRSGYEIILSVHDELLTETEDSEDYNEHELAKMMSRVPPWARGRKTVLPLNADGFSDYRYRK
ncbi:dna polymerase a family protein [Lasius niger]|uniref:Dna polymerase a family protein n=1 Tax=Lasius niger TaxID=67767 RepID=A0A0J7NZG0_LASNI|nr:dna polymerase a family protein [Lasius niger]